MSLQRELVWQNLNLAYQSTVAYQVGRYALSLKYEMLPEDVVHEAKRCILDTLGCAIGAYIAPGRPIMEAVAEELGGTEEATVYGSGLRTNVLNAALINSFLVRFLEYNDQANAGYSPGHHNSSGIPSIMAVAEREKTNGKEFLTSVVLSYELDDSYDHSIIKEGSAGAGPGGESGKWMTGRLVKAKGGKVLSGNKAGFTIPPSLGRLMGLNEEQIAHAIGICTSHSLPLGILDSNTDEYTMAKNLVFGWCANDAILACMQAKKGFTGPIRIFESEAGVRDVVYQGGMDLHRLVDFSGWSIRNNSYKTFCANGSTHSSLYATLGIVEENDLKPDDIKAVHLKVTPRVYGHTTFAAKKYPRNAESADHSAFYTAATIIKERRFGPEAFEPSKFTDPVILDLIEKITVEADPSLTDYMAATSVITTKDGRRFQKSVGLPHGFGDDPLTDEELETKFRDMAIKYMGEEQIKEIFDTIWNIEKLDDVGKLTKLMVFPNSTR